MKKLWSARALLAAGALAAGLSISACSSTDLVGNDLQAVSLSFTAGANGGASVIDPSVNVVSSTPPVLPAITKVQLVITKMELGRTEDVACVTDNDDEAENAASTAAAANHDCEHVTRDPLLIDMPVDGTLRTQLNVPLAAGTYRKLEAKLSPVTNRTPSGAAFLAAHPDFAGISLRVTGTYNAVPFTYKIGLRAAIQMKFNPPLVINTTTKNATVTVDVSKWFVTMHGEVLNPSQAQPGSPAARIIENNIRASFHAFKDDNKRGKDEDK